MNHSSGQWVDFEGAIVAMPSQVKVAKYVSGANAEEAEANRQLIVSAPVMHERLRAYQDLAKRIALSGLRYFEEYSECPMCQNMCMTGSIDDMDHVVSCIYVAAKKLLSLEES